MGSGQHATSYERYYIRSITRALEILQLFLNDEGELSISEISKLMGLSQSTTFRILVTLAAFAMVEQNHDTNKYRLGVTCLALGDAFRSHSDIQQRAISSLTTLRDETGETVHLGILIDHEVMYYEKLSGLHPIGMMSSRVGRRAPAHCTAMGKVLLAYIPEEKMRECIQNVPLVRRTPNSITDFNELLEELAKVHNQGYAVDGEENEEGVGCVAAPIFDHTGVVAAVSASGPVDRIYEKISRSGLVFAVQRAGREISTKLGGGSYQARINSTVQEMGTPIADE